MKYFSLIGITFVFTFLMITGCATKATDIQPADINSTMKEHHQSYNCNQLKQKHEFIDKKLKRLSISLNDDSSTDNTIAATGWILYGVPYLFLGGDDDNEEKYAQLLGLREYIEELMIAKDCGSIDNDTLKIEKKIIFDDEREY